MSSTVTYVCGYPCDPDCDAVCHAPCSVPLHQRERQGGHHRMNCLAWLNGSRNG